MPVSELSRPLVTVKGAKVEPSVGDDAPDFELPLLDGKGRVRLSSYRDRKPVALIFGSYT